MIALLVMTDGRDDLLMQTVASAAVMLQGPITHYVMHTDNGPDHRAELAIAYPTFDVIGGPRLGFGGAIDRAWRHVAHLPVRYVFHLEDDFTFNRTLDLRPMAHALYAHTYLAQLALRRQPWNDDEAAAGGIVEMWPDEYTDVEWEGEHWLEHRLFWTTNPSLLRVERCGFGWPVVKHSERFYTERVLASPESRFAFWGARDSGEWVRHIGAARAGSGY